MAIIFYWLTLHLCCQTDLNSTETINVDSPQEAAVVLWTKNQNGRCYEGKLVMFNSNRDEYPPQEIKIPKINFE